MLQVVSVYETGLPHVLDPHTLDTLGPDNFGGALKLKQFAAHFRIDSENNVRSGQRREGERRRGEEKGGRGEEKGGRGGMGEGREEGGRGKVMRKNDGEFVCLPPSD